MFTLHKVSHHDHAIAHHDSSIRLGSITETQAQDLNRACSPATFGLNNQDVFDESYRKAGKLDVGKFSWPFSPASRSDFIVQLISGLFPSDSLRKGIRFELYKLNVYGETFLSCDVSLAHTTRGGIVLQSSPRYTSQ